jgi:rod shape determining protein RodA
VIGIIALAATEVDPQGVFHWTDIITKQVIFVVSGLLIFLGISNTDYTYFKYSQVVLFVYAVTLILLVLTLFFGEEIKNVQRWLNVAGVQVQASEIAKLTVILTTAYIFTLRDRLHEYTLLFISFLATLPFIVLIFLQPHGSMALLILLLWFITAFVSMKNQLKNTVLLVVLGLSTAGMTIFLITQVYTWLLLTAVAVIIFLFGLNVREHWKAPLIVVLAVSLPLAGLFNLSWDRFAQDYQRARILAFQSEQDEAAAFNVNQAKIAIGSGKIFGKGWGKGTQGKLNFLPEHQTDFIFASYAEEFGLVGAVGLLMLYLFLLYSTFRTAIVGGVGDFGAVLLVAIGMKILLELFINIGTNTGVTPATGIPLPLISAGGSITVMTFFSLGLIQSIMKESKEAVTTYFD